MSDNNVPIYTIKSVVALTGLPAETIRAWERRYEAIAPQRSGGGHRLYRATDVDRLVKLRRAVGAGHAIGRIAQLPDEELSALSAPAPQPASPNGSAPTDRAEGQSGFAERALAAIQRFDQAAAAREFETAAALLPARQLVAVVVLPLLEYIGTGWDTGRVGIAQEHIASNLLRGLLGTLMRLAEPRPELPSAVLATPPGDLHELGLLCVGLVMASRGVRVTYLGAQVPASELVAAAAATQATLVGVGLGIVRDPAFVLGELDHLAAHLPAGSRVWVGGRGAGAMAIERLPARCRVFTRLSDVERELDALI